MLDLIVSTCIARDIEIWKVAASNILKFIESRQYVVIVPENELQLFRLVTPSQFEVINENSISPDLNLNSVEARLHETIKARKGWYLQQFLKIEYLRRLPEKSFCLIWDADTIPLRELAFTRDDRILYRLGNHRPKINNDYFSLIKHILSIERNIDESFISQCFPTKALWVKEFCAQIESKFNRIWWHEALAYLERYPSHNGFSEYESLGTFISQKFKDEIFFQRGSYFRPGHLLCPLGSSEDQFSKFSTHLEYIAYDSYDSRQCSGLNLGCGTTRIERAYDGNLCLNIDNRYSESVDLVIDISRGLPFSSNSILHIIANNVLEHMSDPFDCLLEINRVLRAGGVLQIQVPHVGSYNHGTDITHRYGFTFDTFNFMILESSYLYPSGGSPFKYRLISFSRETIVDGKLTSETTQHIPKRGTYEDWLSDVRNFHVPGSFSLVLQKLM